MNKICLVVVSIIVLTVQSCSKKTIPNRTTIQTQIKSDTSQVISMHDTLVAIKPIIKTVKKQKPKESIPQVMAVNDKFAKKSVDGRFYYDLQGHRYWRSNKDGKYYLFNKSMLTDAAFKKPQ